MTTKIIAVTTLVTLSNLNFAGCSKVVHISPEEIAKDTPKRIIGIVLKTGEEVTFNSTGGDYEPARRRIRGESPDGTRIVEPLSKLDSVSLVDLAEDSLSSFSLRAQDLHDYLRPKQSEKIVSVTTKQSVTHKFWSGYRIDPVNNVILGRTTRDSTLRVPLDSVAYFGVKRPDGIKTMVFVAVILVGCFALFAVHGVDLFGDGDRGLRM